MTHPELTHIEDRVMQLVCDGLTLEDIALEMDRSPDTVRKHRDNARVKLHAAGLAEAAARYAAWRERDRLARPRRRQRVIEGQLEMVP